MRKINKNIILLSIIVASALVNNSNIAAATVKKNFANKNHELIETNKTAIENSLKNNDYNLFVTTLKGLNIDETVTNDQFTVLVNAYTLFKNGQKDDAVKLLGDNNVNPVVIKFLTHANTKAVLTDAQKATLKQATDLVKQGKIDEAKALITSAGLPETPAITKKIDQVETKAQREAKKTAFTQARALKKEGKIDEAKKVLKDAGIEQKVHTDTATTTAKAQKVGFLQSLKNLFIK